MLVLVIEEEDFHICEGRCVFAINEHCSQYGAQYFQTIGVHS